MELEWVPSACTLPADGRPLRVTEFDALFATATSAERVAPGELRFALPREQAETAASLAVRETGCCSFFTFTLTVSAGELTLGVSVAEPHVEVLAALAARAGA